MTPEERTLLSDLFRHLREVESQPRDAEAEATIRQSVQEQPHAPYYMAQTVLVQQQALTAAQQRIEQLERQLKDARERQPAATGGSFLSNALGLGRGSWGGRTEDRQPEPPPASRGPWGAPPPSYAPPPAFGQPGYGSGGYGQPSYAPPPFAPQPYPSRGGGFLAGAAQTAAGVAGGMLAASAISSLLHHSPGPFGEAVAGTAPVSETIVNNFYGDNAGPARDVAFDHGGGDPDYRDADYRGDDLGGDSPDLGGGGGGGGEDDSWI